MKKLLCLFIPILLLCCTSKENKEINRSLSLAGENRNELEKVLTYYADDSIKLKAAGFLIRNMVGMFHVDKRNEEPLLPVYQEHVEISERNNWEQTPEWGKSIDSLSRVDQSKYFYTKENDLKTITSDYLIRNIDQAFNAWKGNAYTKDIPFEIFCEYILPYKFKNGLFLDDHREVFYQRYFDMFREKENLFIEQIDSILYAYKDIRFSNYYGQSIPLFSPGIVEQLKWTLCEDRSWYNSLLFASLGIPVSIDFVPSWGNRNNSHLWNTLITEEGVFPFEPFWDEDRWSYKTIYNNRDFSDKWGKFRLPKVFRQTFSINSEVPLFDKDINIEDIPVVFRNPRITDVSHQYFDTSNVVITLPDTLDKIPPYLYLCVYDKRSWTPVQWGKVNRKQVVFSGMGRDIVYVAAIYKDQEIYPVGSPFYLSPAGDMQYLEASEERGDLFVRSVGFFMETDDKIRNLKDINEALFIGTDENNTIQDTLHQVSMRSDVWGNSITINRDRKYRYVDIYFPTDTVSFCEVSFYTKENGISQRITNVELLTHIDPLDENESVSMINDGLSATGFRGVLKKNVARTIRFDLGDSYLLNEIHYVPYNHCNLESSGYKLCYWDRGWRSVAEKQEKGDRHFLEFKNIPKGSLYRLENDAFSQRRKERIFLYENGRVRWM